MENEFTFRAFGIYLIFLCIYFIGVTDTRFLFRIQINYLENPFMLSIMLTDMLLLMGIMFARI